MTALKEGGRAERILAATVESFIRTGEPVSSAELFRRYRFGIKPAMIRIELERLTDEGFLDQPYHSAGRVPSDKGYEFFIGEAMEEEGSGPQRFSRLFAEGEPESLIRALAEELGILGVARELRTGEVLKTGLDCLMDNLDCGTPGEVRGVIRDFVEIDRRLARLEEKIADEDFRVFVGRKSPVTTSAELAVLAGEYKFGDGEVLLTIIGPKRMDYKKAIQIFKSFSHE